MRRADLLDISHHNTVTSWADVPAVPIVHKVNEGTSVDTRFAERMPVLEDRGERFGGYTVLISQSRLGIAGQVERYAELMAPFWRVGACTQLDVEPWPRYNPPAVDAGDIVLAYDTHVDALGRPPALYINPRQMPGVLEQVRAHRPDVVLWEAHYGAGGHASAVANRAAIHQWTSRYAAPGFTAGIDANELLDPAGFDLICGLDAHPTVEVSNVRLNRPARRVYDSRRHGDGRQLAGKREHVINVDAKGAAGVVVNLTITEPVGPGFVTLWDTGERPDASHVNYGTGQTIANAVHVPVAADGTVRLWTLESAHVVLDVQAVLER